MNLQTIANALATTIGTVTATSGTETESATASADLPNSVARLALVIYPPTNADLNIIMGPRYDDQYDFVVRLLRDPVDVPTRTRWLYAWATALRARVQTDFDLGVAGVTQTQSTAMRVELDGEKYASSDGTFADFDVVEMTARVWVLENTTVT